jgi:hypothetical protein
MSPRPASYLEIVLIEGFLCLSPVPSSECESNAFKKVPPAIHSLTAVSYFFVAKYLRAEAFQHIEKS